MVTKLLWLAGAGAAGTLARYGLAGLVQTRWGASFPVGTAAVNLLGCFLAGFIWALCEERGLISTETRALVLIGFMGAFTTFSAFMLETTTLLQDAEWLRAAGNLMLQNTAGLVLLFLGIVSARIL